MSYLSNELMAVLQRHSLTQKRVAEDSGLGVANISRIFSGTQAFVTSEDLDRIIPALTKDAREQGKIVKARLHDAYDGEYAGLVNITVKGGNSTGKRVAPHVSMNPAVRDAIEFLCNRVYEDTTVGDLLRMQALALGWRE